MTSWGVLKLLAMGIPVTLHRDVECFCGSPASCWEKRAWWLRKVKAWKLSNAARLTEAEVDKMGEIV